MLTKNRLVTSLARILFAVVLIGASLVNHGVVQAAGGITLKNQGTGGLNPTPAGTLAGDPALEFQLEPGVDAGVDVPAAVGLPAAASRVVNAPSSVLGAAGINHYDNRTADGGNQFSIEPPDQALCVGNGFVFEGVNLAVGVRSAATNQRIGGITSLNKFFGLPSAINRSLPAGAPRFGPFLSDPKCIYDTETRRFFVSTLEMDQDPVNRNFTGKSNIYLAVSKTSDPTAGFQVFSFDTSNDGSNGVTHPDCPCFGDQPLIGMDHNGLYISTNEFPLFVGGFNGAQIYGISKRMLAKAASAGGSLPAVAYINAGAFATPDAGGIWYTVQPALAIPHDTDQNYEQDNSRLKGVEYFLSALDFFGTSPDNRVALWALTNTNSLQSAAPNLSLQVTTLTTHTAYISPDNMVQKTSTGTPVARAIDGGDDRMQQVVKSGNTLFGTLNMAVAGATPTSPTLSGVAYWGINPKWHGTTLDGQVKVQGVVSVAGNSLSRPSVAINASGHGLIAFSLVGPDYFPSAAYINFDSEHGASGPVNIAAAGVAPDIGFSGVGGGRQRWGDYTAAVDDQDNLWAAAEYIPVAVFPAPAQLANWGTYIFRVSK